MFRITRLTYSIVCDNCGCEFTAIRTNNKSVFFDCPGCGKKGGINPKEKIKKDDENHYSP
jgi:hypothetical protein